MLDISEDIHSLSQFKRNTSEFIQQMKATKRPVVLTVNGRAEVVVQDAESYQKLLEMAERLEAIEAIRQGLSQVDAGQTISLEAFDQKMRQTYGLPD